jgi:hypothetical protein
MAGIESICKAPPFILDATARIVSKEYREIYQAEDTYCCEYLLAWSSAGARPKGGGRTGAGA